MQDDNVIIAQRLMHEIVEIIGSLKSLGAVIPKEDQKQVWKLIRDFQDKIGSDLHQMRDRLEEATNLGLEVTVLNLGDYASTTSEIVTLRNKLAKQLAELKE